MKVMKLHLLDEEKDFFYENRVILIIIQDTSFSVFLMSLRLF